MRHARQPHDDLTPKGRLEEGAMHGLLGYQLAQATILTTSTFIRATGKPMDLRPVEFTILQLVNENAPVTPGRLSKALGMTAPGVSVWLDRLEARELLTRERSTTDRRAQNVSLTAQGRELVSQALTCLLAAEQDCLRHLSEGERTILLELLYKVARSR
jgi:DNA-binding MarR family transcriptional regulator